MPNINKLLNKVNQATQAIKSVKGIKSKIESIGYKGGVNTEEVGQLQSIAEDNRRKLEERANKLQSQLSSVNSGKKKTKKPPPKPDEDLQYPLDLEGDNYIVFTMRARKSRGGDSEGGGNYFSDAEQLTHIALYIPDDITQASAVSYKEEGVGSFQRGMSDISNAEFGGGAKVDATIDTIKNVVGEIGNKIMGGLGGSARNLKQGMAVNPMQEQMLEGVAFREHTFAYDFYPKSEEEAKVVMNIIRTFRLASLPDTFASFEGDSPNENFFNYPNVFDVTLEGPIAAQVEGFLPMVLKDITVDTFGGNSKGLIAQEEEGSGDLVAYYPAHSSMSLTFTEIRILTQETYDTHVGARSLAGDLTGGSPSILDNNTGG